LGIDRIHDFLAGFGLGSPTGINVRGEKAGIVPSRNWKKAAFAAVKTRSGSPAKR
jgi:penicillin-binding protein 2